ncbi:stage II sporulation protein M [uncultured Anaerococcus sp.]|uniref:stage II sporulation protein M n=1 Tax=uncultured Anaerococcus sp. TaxID=293428 RepID=UPI0025D56B66|nr:stage II sporulation protein M [uncultured Anaerococcus sp.]
MYFRKIIKNNIKYGIIIYIVFLILGFLLGKLTNLEILDPNTRNMSQDEGIYLFATILKTNILAIFSIIKGIFVFGACSFKNLIINAYVLGYNIAIPLIHGESLIFVISIFIFHGVIEISAIILSFSVGIVMLKAILELDYIDYKSINWRLEIIELIKCIILILLMVVLSAAMEAYISIPLFAVN